MFLVQIHIVYMWILFVCMQPSSNPVALTFSDAFLAINEDDIPSGSGPHMFVSYVDEWFVFIFSFPNIHIA